MDIQERLSRLCRAASALQEAGIPPLSSRVAPAQCWSSICLDWGQYQITSFGKPETFPKPPCKTIHMSSMAKKWQRNHN